MGVGLVWPLTLDVCSFSANPMLNEDYKGLLHVLSEEEVEWLLVGAYAVVADPYPRATMDIDIWVKPDAENGAAARSRPASIPTSSGQPLESARSQPI